MLDGTVVLRGLLDRPVESVVVRGGQWSAAAFSLDGYYRYALYRWVADSLSAAHTGTLVACLLNPSTADANADDATIRKLRYYTRREGLTALLVVNAFAVRGRHPQILQDMRRDGRDPIGPHNDIIIDRALRGADVRLGGWGRVRWNWMAPRFEQLRAMAPWQCLNVTADGNPTHPLYQPNDAPLLTHPWSQHDARA